jgi:uncharacterized membrane protein YkvA (DUF1232 family)
MTYKLTIELSERDLRHFQREMRRTRESVRIADDEDIIQAARDVLAEFAAIELPDFVADRLAKVRLLLEMLDDGEWPMSEAERAPILAGLAYLCDPEDIIPDSIPGIGLLDDAVMIELVFRELRHEIEAYEDFARFRRRSRERSAADTDPALRAARLEVRRKRLRERMQRRRRAEAKRSRDSAAGPLLW